MKQVGIIVGGEFNKIFIREKSTYDIELGELLISEVDDKKYVLEVYDIVYGSQISQQKIELFSGFNLETNEQSEVFHKELRLYKLVVAKPLIIIENKKINQAKSIPPLFTPVRAINEDDLKGLFKDILEIGAIRSGSKILKESLKMNPFDVFSHHVLVPAQTGKGKSNLIKTLLWNCANLNDIGFFVLDPHNEYFYGNKERNEQYGLKDHPKKEKIFYFASSKESIIQKQEKASILKISIKNIRPHHFVDILSFTEAQEQVAYRFYHEFKEDWIRMLFEDFSEERLQEMNVPPMTLSTLRRKISFVLDLDLNGNSHGIFVNEALEKDSIKLMIELLEHGKIVILDTSNLKNEQELVICSMVASEIFWNHQNYKNQGILDNYPLVTFVLEEAPRLLNDSQKANIFSSIAREGRKFKIGLVAITQLPSLIPREILANMNTKIILGIEMSKEREVVINSSAQDIEELSKSIASLDKGEAIITSSFLKFPVPVSIPLFTDVAKQELANSKEKKILKKEELFEQF
ncbi:MAG: ATP-binding protein [Candidatus Woesearchaeota archaeon]